MTAAMFAILVGLGVWQLQRLAWKEGILTQIARAESGAATPLPADPRPFAKVYAVGHWADVSARYGVDVRTGPDGQDRIGSYLLTPLLRDDTPPVLVDRGWYPDGPMPAPPAGEVRVEGYVRGAERPGWLSPPENDALRHFYTPDPERIGKVLGVPSLAPFTLVAMGPPDQLPSPAQTLPRPPNNHLSYALTWFGLALVLALIFASYAREVFRSHV